MIKNYVYNKRFENKKASKLVAKQINYINKKVDISDNDKKEIISYFYSIVNYKYGNLNTVNKDLLSSKIDMFSIDYDNINIINYEDSVNKLERKINRR